MAIEIDIEYKNGDFELEVDCCIQDRMIGISGPSASGKTTLLHILAGLIKPQTGHIVIDECEVFNSAKGVFIPPHKRKMGVVFQDVRLFPHMDVRQNLMYGMPGKTNGNFADVVSMLQLRDLLGCSGEKLSGGQRQRVALGRALLAQPDLLLLDEPLSAIDTNGKSEILRSISEICARFRTRVIIVSHNLNEISYLASMVMVIKSGRLITSYKWGQSDKVATPGYVIAR